MIGKIIKKSVFWGLVTLPICAFGAYPEEEFELLKKIYNGSIEITDEALNEVQKFAFSTPQDEAIALSQMYSLQDSRESIQKAFDIVSPYIQSTEGSLETDVLKIHAAFILSQQGRRAEAAQLIETLLSEVDFTRFSSEQSNYTDFMIKRRNISADEFGIFMKDHLLRMLGYDYLNRSPERGEPDHQAARNIFELIENPSLKKSSLADARVRKLKPTSQIFNFSENINNAKKRSPPVSRENRKRTSFSIGESSPSQIKETSAQNEKREEKQNTLLWVVGGLILMAFTILIGSKLRKP